MNERKKMTRKNCFFLYCFVTESFKNFIDYDTHIDIISIRISIACTPNNTLPFHQLDIGR